MSDKVDRRVQRTRQLLSDALFALMREQPFEAITVQAITDRANLARATFYLHYKDKHDLLWRSMETTFDELDAQLGQINPETLLVQGKPLTHVVFAHIGAHADLYRALFEEPAFVTRLQRYLAYTSERHHAPLRRAATEVRVPPAFTANYLAGAVLGLAMWWLHEDDPLSPEEMARLFTQLAAPGVLEALGMTKPG